MTENKRNRGTRRIKIVAVLLIAVLAYLTVTTISIVSFSKKDETRKADAAINILEKGLEMLASSV